MIKVYLKLFLLWLMFAKGQASAQSNQLFVNRKYPLFNSPGYFINKAKSIAPAKLDTINLFVTDGNDIAQIIAAGLNDKVFSIKIQNNGRPHLTDIFRQSAQLAKLRYLLISDYAEHTTTAEPYQLPTEIKALKQLNELEFAYTNQIDMDDALKKLLPMHHLHKLVFTEYEHQLPATLIKLKQITDINISTENIGDMNIGDARWLKAEVNGYHIRDGRKPYLRDGGKPQADALNKLSEVKALKDLTLWLYQLSDTTVFSRFKQIKNLRLDGTLHQSPTIFNQLGQLTSLKTLDLWLMDRSAQPVMVGGLQTLTNLKELKMLIIGFDSTRIQQFETLSSLKKLEVLEISDFGAVPVPDIFDQLPRLKKVWLNGGITALPLSLFNLPALQYLNLSRNQLTQLPSAEHYGCKNLKMLELGANQLTQLPPAITRLPNLEFISASDNELTDAGNGWQNLKHLKQVDFARNKLKKLPDGLQDNRSVEWINLHENKLTKLPDAKVGKYNLKFLTLSGNPLRTATESK